MAVNARLISVIWRVSRLQLATSPPTDTVAGIRLFIRVVETGCFSRVSVELGITQPTATKHVAALEVRLRERNCGNNNMEGAG